MTEIEQICQELKAKESLELVGRLLSIKKANLLDIMLKGIDKDKVWDDKQLICFIDGFIREISMKSNKDED